MHVLGVLRLTKLDGQGNCLWPVVVISILSKTCLATQLFLQTFKGRLGPLRSKGLGGPQTHIGITAKCRDLATVIIPGGQYYQAGHLYELSSKLLEEG